jgi:surface antigen
MRATKQNGTTSLHTASLRTAGTCALALILCLSCAPALAQWVSILKNSPAERFNEDDLQLFLEAARKARDAPVNETIRWENPATRANGDLTVRKIFQWKQRPCREVAMRNEAGGRKGNSVVNLCEVDGKWKLVSPSELKK